MNQKLARIVFIVVLASLGTVFLGSAAYVITSNHITGNPATNTITLTSNSTSPIIGDTLQLTAKVTSPLTSWSIQLYNNGVTVGSPLISDANGNAVWTEPITAAYDYTATATHS